MPRLFRRPFFTFVFVAALFAWAAAFPSSRSFWLDEVRSAAKAVCATFGEFRSELLLTGGSDVQMPLYMAALWLWEKVFGGSELVLRRFNLVFFALAVFAMLRSARGVPRRVRMFWCLFFALSPAVAFYLDEARPYVMLASGGALVAAGLAGAPRDGSLGAHDVRTALCGCVLLAATSLTGAVFSACPCLFLAWRAARDARNGSLCGALRRNPVAVPLAGAALAALLAYYVWTLLAGFRGTHAYSTNLLTLGHCAYELTGAAGLGPARDVLRGPEPLRALRGFALPLGVFAAAWLAYASAWICSVRVRGDSPMRRIGAALRSPLFVCTAISVAMLVAGGVISDLRILARHLIPSLPPLLLALAYAADEIWGAGFSRRRIAVAVLCAVWCVSALSQRFNPRHSRDDDRSAAAFARAAAINGARVWWGGDKWTFEYYPGELLDSPDACTGVGQGGAPAVRGSDASGISLFPKTSELETETVAAPDVAVFSVKYDISDPDGSRREFLRAAGLAHDKSVSIRGFVVWTRERRR